MFQRSLQDGYVATVPCPCKQSYKGHVRDTLGYIKTIFTSRYVFRHYPSMDLPLKLKEYFRESLPIVASDNLYFSVRLYRKPQYIFTA